MWISDQGNPSGNAPGDPTGTYTIRTKFLLDQASPTNLFYQSGFECDGTLTNILLNGQSTGFNFASVASLYANRFSLSNYNGVVTFNASGATIPSVTATNTNSNYFVPGLNTLDFVLSSSFAAIKVDSPTMIGYALPPGLPTILQQPASETVRDANITGPGSDVGFSVVALGRPPLSYQWYSNGFVMPGVTSRTAPATPIPRRVCKLRTSRWLLRTVQGRHQSGRHSYSCWHQSVPYRAQLHELYMHQSQTLSFDISVLFDRASSPDGDTLTLLQGYDTSTTNGVGLSPVTSRLFLPTLESRFSRSGFVHLYHHRFPERIPLSAQTSLK